MRYTLFGGSGLRVSELFLGAMTFGEQGGVGAPPQECARILGAYADAGGNVIDTAINYRGGASEEIVGELLQGRRDRFVLSTKYTVSRDAGDPNAAGNHRKNLRLSLETSLRRLRTDYIDIYWVHMWDAGTPAEETMRALDDQVRAGKILYAGISDAPAWVVSRANTLAQWRGWTAFAGVQAPYSLLRRDIERELLPMAETLGLTLAAWSPLADGILSGKYAREATAGQPSRIDPAALTDHQHAVAALRPESSRRAGRHCGPGRHRLDPGPLTRYSPDHRRPPPRPATRQPRRRGPRPARRGRRAARHRDPYRPRFPGHFHPRYQSLGLRCRRARGHPNVPVILMCVTPRR